jgi:hypothetical protein
VVSKRKFLSVTGGGKAGWCPKGNSYPSRVFIEGGISHVYRRASRAEAVFADQAKAAPSVGILQRTRMSWPVGGGPGGSESRASWWPFLTPRSTGSEPVRSRGGWRTTSGSVRRWITAAAERRGRDSDFARRLGKPDDVLRGEGAAVVRL